MLQVTERAAALLLEIQADVEEAKEKTLRLVSRDDQFELTFDTASQEDKVFQCEGTDVLLVSPDVADTLGDAVIDAQDTPEGPRFTLSTGSA